MSYKIKRKRSVKCEECGSETNGYFYSKRLCGNCVSRYKSGNALNCFKKRWYKYKDI